MKKLILFSFAITAFIASTSFKITEHNNQNETAGSGCYWNAKTCCKSSSGPAYCPECTDCKIDNRDLN